MASPRSEVSVRRAALAAPSDRDETWRDLVEAYHKLRRNRSGLLAELDLSWSEYVALQLCALAPSRASDIAEAAGITSAGATDVIDRLEARRLVRRESHPKDRRALLVELTRAGERLYTEAQSMLQKTARTFAGELTERERDALVTGLRALIRALDARPS